MTDTKDLSGTTNLLNVAVLQALSSPRGVDLGLASSCLAAQANPAWQVQRPFLDPHFLANLYTRSYAKM
jgi:hypothetical protein